ncbi:DUF1501 domain-containing protein [Roseimaritima sediminicola]|uniref:DUF1501 domain-containing protein n=1 Tax=Roseimaritima sediminicola TaxID=2662066 RepID=UPI00192A3A1B|nr:DUF1501 domain-containing protein [Roseimaritima sediminicola]
MTSPDPLETRELTRRGWFDWAARGLGATALLQLLCDPAQATNTGDAIPHFPAKASRAIHICLVGGLSHLDSFDYKPELKRFHGKSLETDEQVDLFFGKMGLLRKEDWAFHPRGESGLMVSEMFPHIARCADELTVIRSMHSASANHTPALFLANSGFEFNGFPSMGSWISYGLGSENDSLPTYVVMNDARGAPNTGASTWSSAFLPSSNQGVVLGAAERPVRDLFPAFADRRAGDQAVLDFIQQVNRQALDADPDNRFMQSRMKSYELAARMQLAVPEVARIDGESAATMAEYGIDNPVTTDMARRCLLGRRLLQRGVRFVQLFSGGPVAGNPRSSWDAHENVKQNHTVEAARIDQPVAALLKDLKQRGMLEDTLVLFTTEFGRTPFAQSAATEVGPGRDHNRYGFSCWMAGAGLRPGTTYGSTDELGWKAVEHPVAWHDLHATILHLFGIDHTRLTHYHNGIQRRLTNVHGHVLRDILA